MTAIINPFIQINDSPEQTILSARLASSLFSPLTREGGAVEVYGERGMGKSSILNCVVNLSPEWQEYFQNCIFIFLNCQDMISPPTANQFWIQIIKEL